MILLKLFLATHSQSINSKLADPSDNKLTGRAALTMLSFSCNLKNSGRAKTTIKR